MVKVGWDRDGEATGEMGERVTPDLISAAVQGPWQGFSLEAFSAGGR